jgi:hypothetical protein
MKTFQISFTGRERGAIGTFYPISFTLEVEKESEIIEKIYEKYEYVQFLKAVEVTE